MQICRGFTVNQWKELRLRLQTPDGALSNDERAWSLAVDVFERRICERFLSCIEVLENADSKSDISDEPHAPADGSTLPLRTGSKVVVPGFSIMALCCLLAETLQSFRCKPDATTDMFKEVLLRPSFNGAFANDKVATSFVRGVRNGILHEAETRNWAVWRNEPENQLVAEEGGGYALNRSAFYRALKAEISIYLQELRDSTSTTLRKRFLKKMNDIVKEA